MVNFLLFSCMVRFSGFSVLCSCLLMLLSIVLLIVWLWLLLICLKWFMFSSVSIGGCVLVCCSSWCSFLLKLCWFSRLVSMLILISCLIWCSVWFCNNSSMVRVWLMSRLMVVSRLMVLYWVSFVWLV